MNDDQKQLNEAQNHFVESRKLEPEKKELETENLKTFEKSTPEILVKSEDLKEAMLSVLDAPAKVSSTKVPSIIPPAAHLSSSIKWNQHKKIPKIYPGIIVSTILSILFPVAFFWCNWVSGGIVASLLLLSTVYWTFCVFRITGQLQYKSKARKIADRSMALLIPLLGNPVVLVTFVGMAAAGSAMFIAFFFRLYQIYLQHHTGQMVHIVSVAFLLYCIASLTIPIFTIPAVCIGWTYKFMVKVALVNEPIEQNSFWKTRGPAILVSIISFIGVELMLTGLLAVGGSKADSMFSMICVMASMLTAGLCQGINFLILWRCVQKKEALSSQ